LFGFKTHGPAAMRKVFVPGDIVMPAFMAVYLFRHSLNLPELSKKCNPIMKHTLSYYQLLYSDFILLGLGIISLKISIPDTKTN
jgi:hypothetical protein